MPVSGSAKGVSCLFVVQGWLGTTQERKGQRAVYSCKRIKKIPTGMRAGGGGVVMEGGISTPRENGA